MIIPYTSKFHIRPATMFWTKWMKNSQFPFDSVPNLVVMWKICKKSIVHINLVNHDPVYPHARPRGFDFHAWIAIVSYHKYIYTSISRCAIPFQSSIVKRSRSQPWDSWWWIWSHGFVLYWLYVVGLKCQWPQLKMYLQYCKWNIEQLDISYFLVFMF